MGGKHSPEVRAARAAALVAELQGISPEEVKITLPVESIDDKMAEAEAVTQYYETRGQYFTHINCRWCGELFAYKWDRHAIKYCSVQHANEALKKLGLKWDPTREQSQRWGRTAPVVVPAAALPHLIQLLEDKNDREDLVADKQLQENP